MDEMLPGRVISPGGNHDSPVSQVSQPPVVSPTPPARAAYEEPPQVVAPVVTPHVSVSLGSPSQSANALPTRQTSTSAELNIASQPQAFRSSQYDNYQPEFAWSASEFIRHDKGLRWYVVYLLGIFGISVGVFLFTRDAVSTVIVLLALTGLLFLSLRKPRIQDFALDDGQLSVGRKVYYLHDFKSFSTIDDGSMVEITLLPLKKIMPAVSVYVPSENAEQISAYMAEYLPFEQRKPDAMDSLLRRIRF